MFYALVGAFFLVFWPGVTDDQAVVVKMGDYTTTQELDLAKARCLEGRTMVREADKLAVCVWVGRPRRIVSRMVQTEDTKLIVGLDHINVSERHPIQGSKQRRWYYDEIQ